MIREYKQNSLIQTFGDSGFLYQAKKQNKKYFMYEFEEYGDAEKYNFKILKKLISSHILSIVEEFQDNDNTYIITDYAETDLLKLQISQPSRVFPLPVALDYFSKIIIALEQLHDSRLVYRNIRSENIKIKDNDVYFSDFTLSQFCKRKQRLFDLVGLQSFMAPEFFGDDGYGNEVDIWAAGILLFYSMLGEYPFKFQNQSEEVCVAEYRRKCQNGFNFGAEIEKLKNPGYIKSNKMLDDFFCKIFALDYRKRIKIKQIKEHKLFQGFFPQKLDAQMLEAIGEEEGASILMTQFMDLNKFKIARDIQKEQLILDFIQKCSESLMLEGAGFIPENIRLKTQFSILKIALIRLNCLIDTFYGKRKPEFNTSEEEWEKIKYTSAFKKVCESIQKKEKIVRMLFNSARVQIQQTNAWFSEEIPQTFDEIKIPYRNTTSSMFEVCKTVMSKNKGNKELMRKIIQIFSRIVILHFINRIFDDQDFDVNFSSYIQWNKGKSLSNLDVWIHSERQTVLRQFIKQTTNKYL